LDLKGLFNLDLKGLFNLDLNIETVKPAKLYRSKEKTIGQVRAVDEVNLKIRKGSSSGFLDQTGLAKQRS